MEQGGRGLTFGQREKRNETVLDNRVLTGKILEAASEVRNELGCGFVESVYKHSLLIAMQDKGLQASAEVPIGVDFRGRPVGKFFADIVVEGQIIIELKAVKEFTKQHFAPLGCKPA